MIPIITSDFEAEIAKLHQANKAGDNTDIRKSVQAICDTLIQKGTQGLMALSAKYDGIDPATFQLQVTPEEIQHAMGQVSPDFMRAIKRAIANISAFHEKQLPKSWQHQPTPGTEWGMRFGPIESVGLYVPGGKAVYPSTVMMNAIPAKIAGVTQCILVTPPKPDGTISPSILATAHLCGISQIYKVGGAQAIFALAYGNTNIPKVAKIVGPGNAYVTEAKQHIYGLVDIDKPAGPSEVLVYLPNATYARYAAADLLAQMEHDPQAVVTAVSESEAALHAINQEIQTLLPHCSRQDIITQAMAHARFFLSPSLEQSCKIINQIAPEHLVLLADNAASLVASIQNAGAIFVGPYTPVTLGDYCAGPNHVLPTSGTAAYASALSVTDFMKFSTVLSYTQPALATSAPDLQVLTQAEGLDAHYLAVKVRL